MGHPLYPPEFLERSFRMMPLWEHSRKLPLVINGVNFVRDVWIETGTDTGYTTAWAAHSGFQELHTIDINPETVRKAKELFKDIPSIKAHHGDSRKVLPVVVNKDKPTTFFLDAHYQLNGNKAEFAPDCECPLLEELEVIRSVDWAMMPLIIIDDVALLRMLEETTIEIGWTRTQWPTMRQVMATLTDYHVHESAGPDVVLYCSPKANGPFV